MAKVKQKSSNVQEKDIYSVCFVILNLCGSNPYSTGLGGKGAGKEEGYGVGGGFEGDMVLLSCNEANKFSLVHRGEGK